MTTRSLAVLALAAGMMISGSSAAAQRRGGGGGFGGGRSAACQFSWDDDNYFVSPYFFGTPQYDGRVTFARIKYQGAYECGQEGPGWSHDYPRTESHFVKLMSAISSLRPFIEKENVIGSVLVRFDEPEIFSYPVAYLSEPGGWNLTPAEMKGLKKYIERGGFIIFDDIEGEPNDDYWNLVFQWQRVFPKAQPIKLGNEHSIFNAFFKIDLSKIPAKVRGQPSPEYWAFFEDNDPKKRMLAIIDKYADVGELIQWSDEGFDLVPSTEGYKLWVNYFIYALTH